MLRADGSEHTSGGPSAFDCERGLRMSADGTSLLRPVSSRPDGWRPWRSRKPLVTEGRINVDVRHFLYFEFVCEEEEPAPSEARAEAADSSDSSSDSDSGGEEGGGGGLRLSRMGAEESRALLSRWLLHTLRPTQLARLEPATLLPAEGERTVFDGTAVYAHPWGAGDVLLWDNDELIHTATATGDVRGRRLMHQIIMKRPEEAEPAAAES